MGDPSHALLPPDGPDSGEIWWARGSVQLAVLDAADTLKRVPLSDTMRRELTELRSISASMLSSAQVDSALGGPELPTFKRRACIVLQRYIKETGEEMAEAIALATYGGVSMRRLPDLIKHFAVSVGDTKPWPSSDSLVIKPLPGWPKSRKTPVYAIAHRVHIPISCFAEPCYATTRGRRVQCRLDIREQVKLVQIVEQKWESYSNKTFQELITWNDSWEVNAQERQRGYNPSLIQQGGAQANRSTVPDPTPTTLSTHETSASVPLPSSGLQNPPTFGVIGQPGDAGGTHFPILTAVPDQQPILAPTPPTYPESPYDPPPWSGPGYQSPSHDATPFMHPAFTMPQMSPDQVVLVAVPRVESFENELLMPGQGGPFNQHYGPYQQHVAFANAALPSSTQQGMWPLNPGVGQYYHAFAEQEQGVHGGGHSEVPRQVTQNFEPRSHSSSYNSQQQQHAYPNQTQTQYIHPSEFGMHHSGQMVAVTSENASQMPERLRTLASRALVQAPEIVVPAS